MAHDTTKVGFIGLGNMGGPMAVNLVKAGYQVMGFDPATAVDGVPMADSAVAACANADIVVTMLPNGAILKSVVNEIVPALNSGSVLLDCSTVDVDSAREVAAQVQAAGSGSLDAPVSGGTVGATAGTLTFMVGGDSNSLAIAQPLLDVMGQKSVHCGDAGAGQAAKICNNMILAITMLGTSEAFALADKLGLKRESMYEVVSASSGYSWSMNVYCPAPGVGPTSPADNNYQPGFASELMLKDLNLSQSAAASSDACTPMGAKALELYTQFVEKEGGNGVDFSGVLPWLAAKGNS